MRLPFIHNFPLYFRRNFSHQLQELYYSVAILDFALAAVVLFEPVYLYQLGYSITHIMLYYVVVYGLYFFIAPLGGIFVARKGPEKSIAISTLMLVGYYGSLLLLPQSGIFFWTAPVFFALQKMFYWPAYHTDFISSSDQNERGKEYSGLWSLATVMYIVGPLMGGAIIAWLGFPVLFAVVIGLILLSNIPLFLEKIPYIPQGFSYWDSVKMPFTREHIRSTLAYVGLGEELVMMTIWPIFIALTFKNYFTLGTAVALATLLTALLTLQFGKWIDKGKWRLTLNMGTITTSLVWFTRPLLSTVAGVFISDTVGRTAKNATFVSMSNQLYERALNEQNVIERAVFFEQGFAVGKLLAATGVIVLAQFVSPFTAGFVWAGVTTLLYMLF